MFNYLAKESLLPKQVSKEQIFSIRTKLRAYYLDNKDVFDLFFFRYCTFFLWAPLVESFDSYGVQGGNLIKLNILYKMLCIIYHLNLNQSIKPYFPDKFSNSTEVVEVEALGSFPFVPPPLPQVSEHVPLHSKPLYKRCMARASGCANNMHPLSWGGGGGEHRRKRSRSCKLSRFDIGFYFSSQFNFNK